MCQFYATTTANGLGRIPVLRPHSPAAGRDDGGRHPDRVTAGPVMSVHRGAVAAHDVRVVPRRTRVAVALGGGGARGYAHIGILEVLRERGYDVISIAGSSMGALVGGLFAADGLDAFSAWVR